MEREKIDPDLREEAFDFFYWFSRFEFALKDAGYLVNKTVGAPAKPYWDGFVSTHRTAFRTSAAAQHLIDAASQQQVVGPGETLEFAPLNVSPGEADLDRVVRYAKTVRNNLFHGGKHGSTFWDDPDRMLDLLGTTITVLKELADLGGFRGDFERKY